MARSPRLTSGSFSVHTGTRHTMAPCRWRAVKRKPKQTRWPSGQTVPGILFWDTSLRHRLAWLAPGLAVILKFKASRERTQESEGVECLHRSVIPPLASILLGHLFSSDRSPYPRLEPPSPAHHCHVVARSMNATREGNIEPSPLCGRRLLSRG